MPRIRMTGANGFVEYTPQRQPRRPERAGATRQVNGWQGTIDRSQPFEQLPSDWHIQAKSGQCR